jgi:nitrite reductase/ring-hydroxylating ferredoxin subunit
MKSEDYAQGDAFQAEKRSLFSTEWLPACAEAQIPKAGDFFSLTVGGWSVIVTRDAAGAVTVLRNMCRHQNMPVVGAPAGNCENFRCRFHGWTYDLKGKFLGAPQPVAPKNVEGESSGKHDMIVLPMLIEAGIVFFSLDSFATRPSLGPALPGYGGTIVTEIGANWKVVVEQLLEEQTLRPESFAWHSPLLALRRPGSTAIVEQIAPHTFLRTRLFAHFFGDEVDDQKRVDAEAFKARCEALQVSRAAGVMPTDDSALLSAFHKRMEAAYAQTYTGSS